MARAHVCGIKRGGTAEDAKQPPRKTTGTTTLPNPNKQEQMQNTQTAAEKKTGLLAAREARLEAERQRAEEEKARAAAEEDLVAALRRQGVEIESLGMGVAGTSREGAEKCWPCWKRDQVCEKREGKRYVTKKVIGKPKAKAEIGRA